MNPLYVPVLLFAGSLFNLIVGRLSRKLCEAVSVLITGLAAVLSIYFFLRPIENGSVLPMYTDGISRLMLLVVNSLGALITLYSVGYMANDTGYTRYYTLILLFIGSMSWLVLTRDLVQLYIFWEMVGVCSALLIAFWWEKPEARRAGLKAFTVTRMGDIGLLLAIALAVWQLNTTDISQLITALSSNQDLSILFCTLLFVAAIGKSAQFPLFVWLPDAMEGPTSVSALIHAATMVKAGVYLIARFYPVIQLTPEVQHTISTIALITIFISAIAALGAFDIKKVLAYSTINHLALMFLALGAGSLTAAIFHLFSHSLFKALLFLTAGIIIHETGTRSLDEVSGLWASGLKILGIAFFVGALSLAGIPPLSGFITKEMVLESMEHLFPEETVNLLSFIICLLSSLYIFRLFFRLFVGHSTRHLHENIDTMVVAVSVLILLTLMATALIYPISSIIGLNIGELKVNFYALTGTFLGLLIAYLVWCTNKFTMLRVSLKPLGRIADQAFYIDRLYTFIAKKALNILSELSTSLQTGNPSVNTLWLISLLLILLIFILGVM